MKYRKVFALCLVLLTLTIIGSSVPQNAKSATATQLKVAELLDQIAQPRFQQDAGMFGSSRLVTIARGHEQVGFDLFAAGVQGRTRAEDALLARANALNHDYLIAFLHTSHVPGKLATPAGSSHVTANMASRTADPVGHSHLTPLSARNANPLLNGKVLHPAMSHGTIRENALGWNDDDASLAALKKAAIAAVPRLRNDEQVDRSVDRWFVAMRPVKATQASCVGCHIGAKLGDTLGAIVYAIDNAALAPPVKTAKNGSIGR